MDTLFRLIIQNQVIIKNITRQFKYCRIKSLTPTTFARYTYWYHTYQEFNNITALLSHPESIKLLRYKLKKDISKLEWNPSHQLYSRLLTLNDVTLQHQIIDYMGEESFQPSIFLHLRSHRVHHSIFIRFLEYFKDKVSEISSLGLGSAFLASFVQIEVEVYQHLINHPLEPFIPFPESFYLVANDEILQVIKNSKMRAEKMFSMSRLERFIKFLPNCTYIGVDDYLTRAVESVSFAYNANSPKFPFNIHKSREENRKLLFGEVEKEKSLDDNFLKKIDVLVLLDLIMVIQEERNSSIFNRNLTKIDYLISYVFKLDDINLIQLVRNQISSFSLSSPIYQNYGHQVGLETYKQLLERYPGEKNAIFEHCTNTIEKLRYFFEETNYMNQFTPDIFVKVSKWKNREMLYYLLNRYSKEMRAGILDPHIVDLYMNLQGSDSQDTDESKGCLDVLEHFVEKGFLTKVPGSIYYYPFTKSELLRQFILKNLNSQPNPLDYNLQDIAENMISKLTVSGMIDTISHILDIFWPSLKQDSAFTKRCIHLLCNNTKYTHHLIVKLYDLRSWNDADEIILVMKIVSKNAGIETLLFFLKKYQQLLNNNSNSIFMSSIPLLQQLISNGHIQEFHSLMKYLYQLNNNQVITQLVNKISIMDAVCTNREEVIHYYMRLHYLYRDRVYKKRFFVNVFQVTSLRKMIFKILNTTNYLLLKDLIEKYDKRANITQILHKYSEPPYNCVQYLNWIKLSKERQTLNDIIK